MVSARRRLVVNADDFGLSHSINSAVIEAHQRGILTSASLMVNGQAAAEAVQLARENPRLGIGLHLTLCCGSSALPRARIPKLVNGGSAFRKSPLIAGLVYFFSPAAREQLAAEVNAQFEKFEATGLALDHLNGHLHFHLHPAVFAAFRSQIRKVRAMRLTYDPASIDWPLGKGRVLYRLSHAVIFKLLARRHQAFLDHHQVAHTDFVFGLLENGLVTESYILRLLPKLPAGISELYSHPCCTNFKHELEALVSLRVRQAVHDQRIELIRYQDLWRN